MVNAESIVNIKSVKKPGHKKRVLNTVITLIVFALIVAASLFFIMPKNKKFILKDYSSSKVSLSDMNKTLSLNGTIDIYEKDTILSREKGICTRVLKNPGDSVKKGEIILLLESKKIEDKLKELEDEFKQVKRNSLKSKMELKRQIRDTERSITKLNRKMIKTKENYLNMEELYKLESISLKQLKDSEDEYIVAGEELEEAKIKLEDLKEDQTLQAQLSAYDITRVEANLKTARKDFDSLEVKSDIDGTLLNVNLKKGEHTEAGDIIAKVGDLNTPYVEGHIPLKKADEIHEGQEVVLTSNNKKFRGIVKSKNAMATKGDKGEKLVYTQIDMLEKPEKIIPGDTIGCEIIILKENKQLTIPRGEFLISGKNRYVYIIEDNKAVKTAVKYGIINSKKVAIDSGLTLGQEIITSSYNDFIEEDIIYISK